MNNKTKLPDYKMVHDVPNLGLLFFTVDDNLPRVIEPNFVIHILDGESKGTRYQYRGIEKKGETVSFRATEVDEEGGIIRDSHEIDEKTMKLYGLILIDLLNNGMSNPKTVESDIQDAEVE